MSLVTMMRRTISKWWQWWWQRFKNDGHPLKLGKVNFTELYTN